jgi:hypothetical protein
MWVSPLREQIGAIAGLGKELTDCFQEQLSRIRIASLRRTSAGALLSRSWVGKRIGRGI